MSKNALGGGSRGRAQPDPPRLRRRRSGSSRDEVPRPLTAALAGANRDERRSHQPKRKPQPVMIRLSIPHVAGILSDESRRNAFTGSLSDLAASPILSRRSPGFIA